MQNGNSNVILAIVWPIGSGKGTASSHLELRYGAKIFKSSGPLRSVLTTMGVEISREKMQLLSRVLRENFGQDIISHIAKREIENGKHRISIFDGARRLDDISPFLNSPNFFLIYVDASPETRYSRIVLRAENGWDSEKSYEEFLKEELTEPEMKIHSLREIARYVIDNSGTSGDFINKLDEVVAKILG